jgi:hypothetical protein
MTTTAPTSARPSAVRPDRPRCLSPTEAASLLIEDDRP